MCYYPQKEAYKHIEINTKEDIPIEILLEMGSMQNWY